MRSRLIGDREHAAVIVLDECAMLLIDRGPDLDQSIPLIVNLFDRISVHDPRSRRGGLLRARREGSGWRCKLKSGGFLWIFRSSALKMEALSGAGFCPPWPRGQPQTTNRPGAAASKRRGGERPRKRRHNGSQVRVEKMSVGARPGSSPAALGGASRQAADPTRRTGSRRE